MSSYVTKASSKTVGAQKQKSREPGKSQNYDLSAMTERECLLSPKTTGRKGNIFGYFSFLQGSKIFIFHISGCSQTQIFKKFKHVDPPLVILTSKTT